MMEIILNFLTDLAFSIKWSHWRYIGSQKCNEFILKPVKYKIIKGAINWSYFYNSIIIFYTFLTKGFIFTDLLHPETIADIFQ